MTISSINAQPRAAPDSGHRFDAKRHWPASLSLGFRADPDNDARITRMRFCRHYGPLRVQRPFYPEGRNGCCHVYLLHPPGGVVSGDALNIEIDVGENSHTLITTPAANKLYKADSNEVAWQQHTHLKVSDGGVLEWLPQETLAFNGSKGLQTLDIELSEHGKCLGWEILGLGRPASKLPFVSGRIEQRFNLTRNGRPLWIERQYIEPNHPRFKGKWGQGGATVQATFWTVGLDDPMSAVRTLRGRLTPSDSWAVTYRREVLLIRYLGHSKNQAWELLQKAWEILRPLLAQCQASVPRIWLT